MVVFDVKTLEAERREYLRQLELFGRRSLRYGYPKTKPSIKKE